MAKKLSSRRRLQEIVIVLTKHRALESLARQIHPEYVVAAFEELGPSFIKLGQLLSVRTDIVKPAFAEGLSKLQAEVTPDLFEEMQPLIEGYAGKPVDELFSSFDTNVLASASIAQVYRATLQNGQPVIVKIQHPGIGEKMQMDVDLLERAIPLIKRIPAAQFMEPAEIVSELKQSLSDELDFHKEADNIDLFYKNNHREEGIFCPHVYREYSNENLLIMDFVEGVTMSEYLEQEHRSKKQDRYLAQQLLDNYMKQVFSDGFFHADPHPGNILVQEDRVPPRFAYIDFGIVGQLDERMMKRFNDLLVALVQEDTDTIAKIVLQLCRQRRPVDQNAFIQDVDILMGRYYDLPIEELSLPEVFFDLSQTAAQYGLVMPRNVTFLAKAIMTLEGIVEELAPDLSIMSAIVPYVQRYIQNSFDLGDEAKKYLKSLLQGFVAVPKIPAQVSKALDRIGKGKLGLTLDHKDLDKTMSRLSRIVNRLVVGVIIASLIMGSSSMIRFNSNVGNNFSTTLGLLGYGAALFLCAALVISVWRERSDR